MKKRAAARRTNHKILREIAMYRDLIHKVAARNREKLSHEIQTDSLEAGDTPPFLSRLLKARQDLANQELDPAERLRQALINLEKDWG